MRRLEAGRDRGLKRDWSGSDRRCHRSRTRAVLLEVQDISDFVREEKKNAKAPYDRLVTPREDVYPIAGRKGVSRTE
jgi:hypothetical protein